MIVSSSLRIMSRVPSPNSFLWVANSTKTVTIIFVFVLVSNVVKLSSFPHFTKKESMQQST